MAQLIPLCCSTCALMVSAFQLKPHIHLALRVQLPLGNLPLSCRVVFPCRLSPFGQAGGLPRYLTEQYYFSALQSALSGRTKILPMYVKGMTTGDIGAHIQDIYGSSVADSTVSRITDKILPITKEWQQRSLESIYAGMFLDAIHYHVRSEGQIVKKAVYIAIGVNLDGRKDALGMWSSLVRQVWIRPIWPQRWALRLPSIGFLPTTSLPPAHCQQGSN